MPRPRLDDYWKENLHDAYDVSGGDNDENSVEIGSAIVASVQVVWSGLTGTLDGVVTIKQSNNNTNYDTVLRVDSTDLNHILNSASGSTTLEPTTFSGERLQSSFVANGCTGGTLTTTLIAKD